VLSFSHPFHLGLHRPKCIFLDISMSNVVTGREMIRGITKVGRLKITVDGRNPVNHLGRKEPVVKNEINR